MNDQKHNAGNCDICAAHYEAELLGIPPPHQTHEAMSSPTPVAGAGTEELLPDASVTYPCIVDHKTLVACLHTVEQILRKPDDESRIARFRRTRDKLFAQARTAPTPSLDTEKEARQAFEDIAHLARERVNVPASEVYALLEHIDRRVNAAIEDLSARSGRLDDKGDRE